MPLFHTNALTAVLWYLRVLLANCTWFSATSETLSYENLEEGLIREGNFLPENWAKKIPFLYCISRPFLFYMPSAFRPFFFDPPAFQEPSFWASRVSNLDQRPTRGSLRSLRQCRGRCNDLTPITGYAIYISQVDLVSIWMKWVLEPGLGSL